MNLVVRAMSFKIPLDWRYLTSKIWHYWIVSKSGNIPHTAWNIWFYIPSISEFLNGYSSSENVL